MEEVRAAREQLRAEHPEIFCMEADWRDLLRQNVSNTQSATDAGQTSPDGELPPPPTPRKVRAISSAAMFHQCFPDFDPDTGSDADDAYCCTVRAQESQLRENRKNQRQDVQKYGQSRHARIRAVRDQFQRMIWNLPGVELLADSMVKTVSVPPAVKILHESLEEFYEKDTAIGPIGESLVDQAVYEGYTLCDGKVRPRTGDDRGKILVPQAIVQRVLEALHSYAHAGTRKSEEVFRRKFRCHLTHRQLKHQVQTVVEHSPVPRG